MLFAIIHLPFSQEEIFWEKKKGFLEGIYSSSVLSKPLLLKEKGIELEIECVGRNVLSPFFFFHGIKRKT